eukprot:762579-Hanusia_phi.AAC.1
MQRVDIAHPSEKRACSGRLSDTNLPICAGRAGMRYRPTLRKKERTEGRESTRNRMPLTLACTRAGKSEEKLWGDSIYLSATCVGEMSALQYGEEHCTELA